jgi:hypothetical protein
LRRKVMKKALRFLVVMVALLAFASTTVAVAAAEFYVAKDAQGKMAVVDKKPADVKSVVKGPFTTKEDAEKALKAAEAAKH